MTIWKFPLRIDDEVLITMPVGAVPLCVQMQYQVPCLWAVVDETANVEMHRFYIRGTGHRLGNVAIDKYIGTFQALDGNLVFHVFDGGSLGDS
jgi:hypothetical protein